MFNLFKAIKSGAKRLAGKALEVVGEKIPGPIGDKLQDIGWDLQYGKLAFRHRQAFRKPLTPQQNV